MKLEHNELLIKKAKVDIFVAIIVVVVYVKVVKNSKGIIKKNFNEIVHYRNLL